MIRCRHCREYADGVPESAGGDVGILPEERHAPMESGDDLQGDGAIYGNPDLLPGAADCLARDRVVAAQDAEVIRTRSPGSPGSPLLLDDSLWAAVCLARACCRALDHYAIPALQPLLLPIRVLRPPNPSTSNDPV